MATDEKKPARRTLRKVALWCIVVPLGVIAAGSFALLRTPRWYRPPQVPAESRQQVRNSLINSEQEFTEKLRQNKPFVYHLYQDDVNNWIAMRREIYPLIDDLAPPVLADPLVIFDDDTITIAGKFASKVDLILSLDLDARFANDGLQFKAVSARCGSMRIPVDLRRLGIDGPADCRPEQLWPGSPEITGNLIDGILVGAEAWWKNGGIDYRVTDFQARPGELVLSVEPLGRHFKKGHARDSDQP